MDCYGYIIYSFSSNGYRNFILIKLVISYLPIFYRIHKRLNYLEKEVKRLNGENDVF